MTSRRKIESKVDRLEEESDHSPEDTLVMNLASINQSGQWPTKGEAKHPELIVQPHPEDRPKIWDYATPNLIPEEYLQQHYLIICAEESHDKYGLEPGEDRNSRTVTVRTLWDSLSEADLQREYEYRNKNSEPIPDILHRYE